MFGMSGSRAGRKRNLESQRGFEKSTVGVRSTSTENVPLSIYGYNGQNGNLTNWCNQVGTIKSYVDKDGRFRVVNAGGTGTVMSAGPAGLTFGDDTGTTALLTLDPVGNLFTIQSTTTPQVRFAYDGSNYLDFYVDAGGNVNILPVQSAATVSLYGGYLALQINEQVEIASERTVVGAGIPDELDLSVSGSCSISGNASTTAFAPFRVSSGGHANIQEWIAAGPTTVASVSASGEGQFLGVDVSTSGRFDSNVADAASAVNFLFKPTTTLTSGNDRDILTVQNQAASNFLNIHSNGVMEVGRGAVAVSSTSQLAVGGPTDTANTAVGVLCSYAGHNSTSAGLTLIGQASSVAGGYFSCNTSQSTSLARTYGGLFEAKVNYNASRTLSEVFGGGFKAWTATSMSSNTVTLMGGCITFPMDTAMASPPTITTYACYYAGAATAGATPTLTTKYGLYVAADHSSSNITTTYGAYVAAAAVGSTNTNAYGMRIEEQVTGATLNYGIFLDNATSGYKAIAIRDANAWIGSDAAGEITVGGTTCNIKSTNIGFHGTAGTAQDTGWGSITNVTTDRAYDANATSVDELADVLGTLIAKLVAKGIIGA